MIDLHVIICFKMQQNAEYMLPAKAGIFLFWEPKPTSTYSFRASNKEIRDLR